jgi:hypothetical protein
MTTDTAIGTIAAHAAKADQQEPLLTREQAAAFLTERGYPTTKTNLDRHASDRTGPQYQAYGRFALYAKDELLAWARHRLRTVGKSFAA